MSNPDPIDFALRPPPHRIDRLFNPCLPRPNRTLDWMPSPCLSDNGAMPPWFWPVLGALLLLVAYVIFSPNNNIVLATQAYIAAFHVGAVLYHRKLGHHPVAGFPASVFVLIAVLVVTIRGNVIVALLGTVACALIAVVLAEILVHPKVEDGQDSLLEDNREEDASPEARGACEAVLGHGEWCNKLVPSALSDVYNGYHESWLPTNVVRYCVGFIL